MPRVISGQSGSTQGEMEGKAIAHFSQATETPWGDEVGCHIPCDISESSVLKNPIDFPLPHPHPSQNAILVAVGDKPSVKFHAPPQTSKGHHVSSIQ